MDDITTTEFRSLLVFCVLASVSLMWLWLRTANAHGGATPVWRHGILAAIFGLLSAPVLGIPEAAIVTAGGVCLIALWRGAGLLPRSLCHGVRVLAAAALLGPVVSLHPTLLPEFLDLLTFSADHGARFAWLRFGWLGFAFTGSIAFLVSYLDRRPSAEPGGFLGGKAPWCILQLLLGLAALWYAIGLLPVFDMRRADIGALLAVRPDLHWARVSSSIDLLDLDLPRERQSYFPDPWHPHTRLHRAAAHSPRTLGWLLSYGAPPDVRSATGLTPLHVAAVTGQLESCRMLVA